MKFKINIPEAKPQEFTKYIVKAIIDYTQEKNIRLFEPPIPKEVFFDGKTLTFEADIIESPKVNLCNYVGIPINKKIKDIPAEDIDKVIKFLKTAKQEEFGEITDDEFCNKMGHYNIDTMRSAIKLEMMREKEKENRLDAIEQIKSFLLKNCKVKISNDILDKLTENAYQEEVNKWVSQGNKIENIPKDGKKMVRKNTEEDTKFKLIIDAIIDKEKIFGENLYVKCIDFILDNAVISS